MGEMVQIESEMAQIALTLFQTVKESQSQNRIFPTNSRLV
jgi:hypothetical protein